MTTTSPPVYDFRKPSPLIPTLREPLAGWVSQVCSQALRIWSSQLPFTIELEPVGISVVQAGSVFAELPDATLRFRSALQGRSESSLLIVPRPLMLALLNGLLGEAIDPDQLERELTSVEESVADLVAQQFFLQPLQLTWPFPNRLRLADPVREPDIGEPPYPLEEAVLTAHFRFRADFGEVDWWWMLPRAGWLESLAGVESPPPPKPEEMVAMVQELPLRLTVNLGTARLSLLHLGALQVGDVLLLDQPIDEPLPATLGGQVKFLVWPGAKGTRQAVAIHSPVGTAKNDH